MCDCKKSKREEINDLREEIRQLNQIMKELQNKIDTHVLHPYPYNYNHTPYIYYPCWTPLGTSVTSPWVMYTNYAASTAVTYTLDLGEGGGSEG